MKKVIISMIVTAIIGAATAIFTIIRRKRENQY